MVCKQLWLLLVPEHKNILFIFVFIPIVERYSRLNVQALQCRSSSEVERVADRKVSKCICNIIGAKQDFPQPQDPYTTWHLFVWVSVSSMLAHFWICFSASYWDQMHFSGAQMRRFIQGSKQGLNQLTPKSLLYLREFQNSLFQFSWGHEIEGS